MELMDTPVQNSVTPRCIVCSPNCSAACIISWPHSVWQLDAVGAWAGNAMTAKSRTCHIPYICGGELARRVYTYVREERSGLACRAYVTEPADSGLLAQRILSGR
jgi:hypothetical protein